MVQAQALCGRFWSRSRSCLCRSVGLLCGQMLSSRKLQSNSRPKPVGQVSAEAGKVCTCVQNHPGMRHVAKCMACCPLYAVPYARTCERPRPSMSRPNAECSQPAMTLGMRSMVAWSCWSWRAEASGHANLSASAAGRLVACGRECVRSCLWRRVRSRVPMTRHARPMQVMHHAACCSRAEACGQQTCHAGPCRVRNAGWMRCGRRLWTGRRAGCTPARPT